MSRQLRAGPTAVLFATAVTAPMLIAPSIGLAQIAVEDDPNLVERTERLAERLESLADALENDGRDA